MTVGCHLKGRLKAAGFTNRQAAAVIWIARAEVQVQGASRWWSRDTVSSVVWLPALEARLDRLAEIYRRSFISV